MYDFDHDKLTENYQVRVPEIAKYKIEKLSQVQKKMLTKRLLREIALVLHEAEFDPENYLKSG